MLLMSAIFGTVIVANLGNTQGKIAAEIMLLLISCLVLPRAYIEKKRKESGELARIKGQHIYGLSAQAEDSVKAILCQDRIVFKYFMGEETRSLQYITDTSYNSERTFVGQTTIAHRKKRVSTAYSATSRGFART